MAAYGTQQPTDAASKKFAGVLTDAGGGANEFVAIQGVGRIVQNGEAVADMSVAVSTGTGAGNTIGMTGDAAASSDTGAFSLVAFVKRLLSKWTDAIGASTDAAVSGDTSGTLGAKLRGANIALGNVTDALIANALSGGSIIARLRGVHQSIGATTDVAVTTDANGSQTSFLRGLVVLVVNLLTKWTDAIGASTDAAVSGDTSGTLGAKLRGANIALGNVTDALIANALSGGSIIARLRGVHQSIGATTDVAVTTDANGSQTSFLRGLVVHWTTHLARMPASLGQKAMTDSLPMVLANDQSEIPVTVAALAPTTAGTYGAAIFVGTSATPLATTNTSRKRLAATNNESGTTAIIWLGYDATVTAGKTGKNIGPLYPGGSWADAYTGPLYGITSSGTAYAAVAETT